MNFYVNFRSAFKAINNNRKRSILTMIGIIIGVSAVIAILAIGRSYERQTIESLTRAIMERFKHKFCLIQMIIPFMKRIDRLFKVVT